MKIKETIIVEGRDDTDAIRKSVDALTIETHGYGIRPDTWELISRAYESTGIIIFTDPDHAGEQIRKRLLEKFPMAKEAFLDVGDAIKDDDIGIENASPESIREALSKAHAQVLASGINENARSEASGVGTSDGNYTAEDMFAWGLTGCEEAGYRRQQLGKRLGIGFANAKTFLLRLNKFGIEREEIERGLSDGATGIGR